MRLPLGPQGSHRATSHPENETAKKLDEEFARARPDQGVTATRVFAMFVEKRKGP
jgi:hypothetical protein